MAIPQNVDPTKIPATMSKVELQDWILFGICVANKEATQTRKKVDTLYELWQGITKITNDELSLSNSPFSMVQCAIDNDVLMDSLKLAKVGQYKRIERAFREAINLNLDEISVEMLEMVHGIGAKTARMIMLYYQPTLEVVPLDTHVLKWLKAQGYENVPKVTPAPGKTYLKWEQIFIEEAKKRKVSVRDLDTTVWQQYAKAFNKKK
jgi:thermostable 8-oxoguanine DNA glycosylase